jgi:hypothetical protein
METSLVTSATIRQLLSSQMLHTDLHEGSINCCLIGEIFLELEKLKKGGHLMSQILSKSSEFDHAVAIGTIQVAALDAQALENGLFEEKCEELGFFKPAVDCSKHPSESVNIIVARDFDKTWTTDFLSSRC